MAGGGRYRPLAGPFLIELTWASPKAGNSWLAWLSRRSGVRQGGHLQGDSGEVTVAFPCAARTTDGPPAAMPRRRAGLSHFREPDTDLSGTSSVFLHSPRH
jgi:hypothetical protein